MDVRRTECVLSHFEHKSPDFPFGAKAESMSDGWEPIPDDDCRYPLGNDPSHCEVAELTFANRRAIPFAEWQTLLAEQLCLRIEGPFPQDFDPRQLDGA